MIELLGLVGGALVRLFPSFLGFLKDGRDAKYELLRMEKEVELERLRGATRMEETTIVGRYTIEAAQMAAMSAALTAEGSRPQLQDTGSWWLNLLNGLNVSVRPVLTYFWCLILYSVQKALIIYIGVVERTPLRDFVPMLVADFDRAVIGSIIGFWFVDRALAKFASGSRA
jgi:hypothetical protein